MVRYRITYIGRGGEYKREIVSAPTKRAALKAARRYHDDVVRATRVHIWGRRLLILAGIVAGILLFIMGISK